MTHWTGHALNATDTERYRLWTPDNWIIDWTLPTPNNSSQTMNAVDCKPANTEHHWLCMLQTLPYRLNALKKLNLCYRLWTLLALNADIGYGLTLNTVYTESYWHINNTELTLHWTLHDKERTNCSERYAQPYPYHKTFKITPWHSTPHGNHHFTPYALLHHTILHHFTLCSPSRPQTFHIIQYTISRHTL